MKRFGCGFGLKPNRTEPRPPLVKWDDKGLMIAIAYNVDTGDILMQGFANREAVATTISSGKATFYIRSRSTLWTKGETSSNFINVHNIFLDCDLDSIIYQGKPDGPTCHTGAETCYYTSLIDLEEADELCRTLEENEDKSRTASEMARCALPFHGSAGLERCKNGRSSGNSTM